MKLVKNALYDTVGRKTKASQNKVVDEGRVGGNYSSFQTDILAVSQNCRLPVVIKVYVTDW